MACMALIVSLLMQKYMVIKRTLSTQPFEADTTLMTFFTCVNSVMSFQRSPYWELSATLLTLIRFLSCVGTVMFLKFRELFVTQMTELSLWSCNTIWVIYKVWFMRQMHFGIIHPSCVSTWMCSQVCPMHKPFVAYPTVECCNSPVKRSRYYTLQEKYIWNNFIDSFFSLLSLLNWGNCRKLNNFFSMPAPEAFLLLQNSVWTLWYFKSPWVTKIDQLV